MPAEAGIRPETGPSRPQNFVTQGCVRAGSPHTDDLDGIDSAVQPAAMRSLLICVSRSQAGDIGLVDVATSFTMVGSGTGLSSRLALPDRLAIHRWLRSARA